MSAPGTLCLRMAALDRLMPMHLWLDGSGRIVAAGPTIRKIAGGRGIVGADFFARFEVRRPGGIRDAGGLARRAGERLFVALRGAAWGGTMRGIAVRIGQDAAEGLFINLSFGIGLADAVALHGLTDSDFAPTDLAVEMLYLIEAKTAVMDELSSLNERLRGAKMAAEEQALTDTLTGLRNRRALDRLLADLIAREVGFAAMQIDLDHFKRVNDTLGHAAGDQVLRHVADILSAETRRGDMVARMGGDEFMVVCPGQTDIEAVRAMAARIIERIRAPMPWQGTMASVSASVGITLSRFYAMPEPDRILTDVDRALYASKNAGRAQVTVCPGEPPPPRA
jgi:diguanylate cyclase (GGDEF)-like protein